MAGLLFPRRLRPHRLRPPLPPPLSRLLLPATANSNLLSPTRLRPPRDASPPLSQVHPSPSVRPPSTSASYLSSPSSLPHPPVPPRAASEEEQGRAEVALSAAVDSRDDELRPDEATVRQVRLLPPRRRCDGHVQQPLPERRLRILAFKVFDVMPLWGTMLASMLGSGADRNDINLIHRQFRDGHRTTAGQLIPAFCWHAGHQADLWKMIWYEEL